MFWLLNLKSSYYVNRDTLFCYHKASEVFLQRLMALYVASHYKVTETSPQMDLSSEFQLLAVPFYLTFCIFCYPVAQVTIPLGLEWIRLLLHCRNARDFELSKTCVAK